MSADKAARLAAIRAANSEKAVAEPASSPVAPTPAPAPKATPAPKAIATAPEDTLLSLQLRIVLGLMFIVVSGLLVLTAMEIWQPIIRGTLPAIEASSYLSMSRSSAMVGYVLLWMSMAFGLAISGKFTRIWPGGPIAVDLHQHLSVLGLIFSVFHVAILLGDPVLNFTLVKALVPFVPNGYRPVWMGNLGKAALYLMVIITLSHYVRSRIGQRWWRRIHYASFATYVVTVLHSFFAGSDSATVWAQALYIVSTLSLVGLTFYRVRQSRQKRAPSPAGLRVGAVRFDPIARVVTMPEGRKVELRITEANLLFYLLQNAGRPLRADQIIAGVWGQGYRGESKLVEGYVRRLRAHIEPDANNPTYIRSVEEGVYQFDGHAPHIVTATAEGLGRARASA
jgi:DMSO/TMAO reductase YedYZ heme-binding membrane subunit/DNA-binding winged helix-turn-helix (wHTH) protein